MISAIRRLRETRAGTMNSMIAGKSSVADHLRVEAVDSAEDVAEKDGTARDQFISGYSAISLPSVSP